MSSFDEILQQIPVSQLASQFGVDESEITAAAHGALPALLGGLQANAADPAGADSIMSALSQHSAGAPTDLSSIDVADGEKIVGHVFGDNTDQVVNQLGGLGGGASGGLVKKLLPMLAPIVLSWLAGKVTGGGGLGSILGGGAGAGSTPGATADGPLFPGGQGAQAGPTQTPSGSTPDAAAGSNPLQDILGQVLGGGASTGGTGGTGDILGGLLGGLLGGGRR